MANRNLELGGSHEQPGPVVALGRRRARRAGPAIALVVSVCVHGAFAALVGGGFMVFGAREPKGAPSIEVDVLETVAMAADTPTSPVESNEASSPAQVSPRTRARPSPVVPSANRRAEPPPSPPIAPPSREVDSQPSAVPMRFSTPVRFSMTAGTIAGRGIPITNNREGSAVVTGRATGPGGGSSSGADSESGEIFAEDRISVPARLLSSASVPYPAAARHAEVEADVQVQLVVGVDGRVDEARVVKPCGYGLDEAALAGVRNFRFSPALRDGRPVRVRMRWPVQFRLR